MTTQQSVYEGVPNIADYRPLGKKTNPAGLKGGGGGSTFDNMPPDLPERVAVLETHVEHINTNIGIIQQDIRNIRGDMKTDFRLTWAGLFFVALGLAGLMAKGFKWI